MWIYLSWWLVLFGARLAYAIEHASFRGEFRDVLSHPRARELVAARIAQLTTEALVHGTLAPSPREIARTLKVPQQMVIEVVFLLRAAQLVTLDRRGGLRPTKAPADLTLADVSAAVGGLPKQLRKPELDNKGSEFQQVERLFSTIDATILDRLGQVSWASLVDGLDPEKQAVSSAARSRERASQNP